MSATNLAAGELTQARDLRHNRHVTKCAWCSRQFEGNARGRPARFCRTSCRQRAYERRALLRELERAGLLKKGGRR